MPENDDLARASVRTAESVVALARAEVRLALAEARALAGRWIVTLAVTLLASFFSALAAVLIVVSPMLFVPSTGGKAATLGTAIALALVASFWALRRWRSHRLPPPAERPETAPPLELRGRDHATQR